MKDIASSGVVADEGIATLLSRVVGDAQDVVRSEIDLQKAKVGAKVGQAKSGVVLIVVALLLASLGSTALVVGLLMILTPLIGPVAATAIVAGIPLVLAGLLGFLATRHFKRIFGSAETIA
ncbi:phage holin family protein [Sphingomonas sp. UYEF23]|jgi:Flp pilus assembly protein TadB|uniref:phage holin family protein n=1 Tax=Sphingomonas sp. UYEF23 TaxID=1756408 RepID=UPI0033928A40